MKNVFGIGPGEGCGCHEDSSGSTWKKWCGCHKVNLFHYHSCALHRGIKKVKGWIRFYPKYWTSSKFRQQCRDEESLAKILFEEIQREINNEILEKMYGEMKIK